jgi:hypothetical protein
MRVSFTTEFLNDIKCSEMPNHKLHLKVGVPMMLLKNIDVSSGLCNGTRLTIVMLRKNVISACVVSGPHSGEVVYITRMNLVPSDVNISITFQRRQFPVCLCFAMTITNLRDKHCPMLVYTCQGMFLRMVNCMLLCHV